MARFAEDTSEELERRRRSQTRVRWELLAQLVRKDLKVKYQNSTLGFVWSLLNPLFLLAVYGFVFGIVLKTGVPRFAVYLMSGLLVWNLFSSGVMGATTSIVGNSGLVKKVRFPLAVLPLASVGFAVVHFVLQLGVFVLVLLVTRQHFWGVHLLLFVPGLLLALTFTIAMAFLVSALNVRYRDTEHLLELLLFAWFWLTAVIYASGLIAHEVGSGAVARLFFSDPMATVVALMHRAFYPLDVHTVTPSGQSVLPAPGYAWYLEEWGIGMAVSLLLLWGARRLFRHMQADFAEEL
jgi:ABC-2 type transport system permease protein